MGWSGPRSAAQGFWSLLVLVALGAAGCGGKADTHDSNRTGGSGGQPMSSTGGSADATGGTTGGAPPLENALGCPGLPDEAAPVIEEACGSISECECVTSRYFFLIERSAKMAEPWGDSTRWQIVTEALPEFEALLARNGGGLAFSGAPNTGDACDPAKYAAPPILVGAAAEGSPTLAEGLALAAPSGNNPMLPALEGLIAFAKQRRDGAFVGSTLVLLTATAPDECDVTSDAVARTVAASGIPTVVIALDADYDVDPIARASGLLPFRIGPADGSSQLVHALRRATDCGGARSTSGCANVELFPPPPDRRLDLDALSVTILSGAGLESLPRVSRPEACATSANGGFYLDTRSPNTIGFCPCSCARMSSCYLGITVSCPSL